MEIYEQRDPAFWRSVLADPDVAPVLFGQSAEGVLSLLQNQAVMPLATENGGLLFVSRCGFGRVWELHSAYRRAGWGREVHRAAKACFRRMFASGADVVFTHEQTDNWRSRPPKSFGFQPVGEGFDNEFGSFRLWMLTRQAWEASPAARNHRGMN